MKTNYNQIKKFRSYGEHIVTQKIGAYEVFICKMYTYGEFDRFTVDIKRTGSNHSFQMESFYNIKQAVEFFDAFASGVQEKVADCFENDLVAFDKKHSIHIAMFGGADVYRVRVYGEVIYEVCIAGRVACQRSTALEAFQFASKVGTKIRDLLEERFNAHLR